MCATQANCKTGNNKKYEEKNYTIKKNVNSIDDVRIEYKSNSMQGN